MKRPSPEPVPIAFARMRWLLNGLRYKEKSTEKSLIFYRSKTNRIIFRRYDEHEILDSSDIARARRAVVKRRIFPEEDFDAFLFLPVKRSKVTFAALRQFVEGIGYRHHRHEDAELFYLSKSRMLIYRRYYDGELVSVRDLASTRSFLDDWNQVQGEDFDAFVQSVAKR